MFPYNVGGIFLDFFLLFFFLSLLLREDLSLSQ